MKDYCGSTNGFRIDEAKRTVVLIHKNAMGEWTEDEVPRQLPLSPAEFPDFLTSESAPHHRWKLAWLALRQDNREKADALFAFATAGYPAPSPH
jgi:hypothetical protein